MERMEWNLLYLLDLVGICIFVLSYWAGCYRRGYRIDYWHLELFLACVFPNMLMLPLARNELNGVVLGRDFQGVVAVLPQVFLISLVGYFSILAGGSLWRLKTGAGLKNSVMPILRAPFQLSMMMMASRYVLLFQVAICLGLQGLILALYFSHNGFGFDLRRYTFEHPALRPIALLASNYSIIIASYCLARYVDTKEKILLASTLLLTFGLLFFGARSNILGIFMTVGICYLIKLRTRINLLRMFALGSLSLAIVLYLGNVRAGQYSLGQFFGGIVFTIFFGNTFSDLRDFAWVYSGWNHDFWLGKTYLAALMAFVPRFLSDFRDTWSLGVVTATTVGFDPQVHPGLRPGLFGEGYFNFGLTGVVGVGLMLGIVARRVDNDVKRALSGPEPSMMKAYASTTLLGIAGNLALSAGFSGLYILGVILVFSWFCLGMARLMTYSRAPGFQRGS
jgi:oligosaccharide repeat unit polymerase